MNSHETERIAAVAPESMTSDQKLAAEIVATGPRGAVRGPFAILLNSPGACSAIQNLGSYLRFESAIPANLRELAILTTAHHWRQEYEWRAHAILGAEAGLGDDLIASLAAGQPIEGASEDEVSVHNFCSQLHRYNQVDHDGYKAVEKLLGVAGVIDLCAICGYYALLAMVMNVARNPVATGTVFAQVS